MNARLADAMELLQQATIAVKSSCSILSGLEAQVEELYLSLDGVETEG